MNVAALRTRLPTVSKRRLGVFLICAFIGAIIASIFFAPEGDFGEKLLWSGKVVVAGTCAIALLALNAIAAFFVLGIACCCLCALCCVALAIVFPVPLAAWLIWRINLFTYPGRAMEFIESALGGKEVMLMVPLIVGCVDVLALIGFNWLFPGLL